MCHRDENTYLTIPLIDTCITEFASIIRIFAMTFERLSSLCASGAVMTRVGKTSIFDATRGSNLYLKKRNMKFLMEEVEQSVSKILVRFELELH